MRPPTRNAPSAPADVGGPGSYDHLLEAKQHRESVTALATLFGAEVVDVGTNQVVFELVSWSRRIDAFLRAVKPYGTIEVARSGAIAVRRSEVFGKDADEDGAALAVAPPPSVRRRSTAGPMQSADLASLPPS